MTPQSAGRSATAARGVSLLGALLMAAIVTLDAYTPLGVPTGALYVVVILLGLWAPPAFALWAAVAGTILTVAGGLLSPPGGDLRLAVVNRALSVLLLWTTAVLIIRFKRVDEALNAEVRRAQRYLDVAGVVIVAIDASERVTLINRRGCEVLGWSEGEILGRNWFDAFVPRSVREELRAGFRQLIAGKIESMEFFQNAIVTRDGRERVIAWHNTLLRDDHQRVVGTLSSGADVTERKAAEDALRQSLKDLADLQYALDQSAIVATTDHHGIINYVNEKFCEISKYSRDELLGQDHRIINSGYHPKEFMRDLWHTIGSGRIWRGEIRNRARDGSIYWVDTTIVPLLDERGKPYQYIAIRSDITERKRAEEALRERAALTRLGQLAAVVAHEVKNPLAGLRGALQVIGGRLPAGSPDAGVVRDMLARIDRLNELVRDLLLFARPVKPRLADVPIATLLRDTATLLSRDPLLAGVRVDVPDGDHLVIGDVEMLRTVFLNLMLNAAQAMGGEGTIEVSVVPADGAYEVTVRDRGPGIPEVVRDRLFEPFFTTKHRGTGLGLAIARRVVEMHQGRIAIDCPPDGGTRVVVTLPAGRMGTGAGG